MTYEAEHVNTVADRLHSAAIHLLRTVAAHEPATVSAPRLSVLSVLVFGGPRSVGSLAAAEGVRSPSMTALVNAMEREGLARRRPDRDDRRRTLVVATPKGRAVLDKARRRRLTALTALLTSLDRHDVDTLDRAAEIIERSLAAPPGARNAGARPSPSPGPGRVGSGRVGSGRVGDREGDRAPR